MVIYEIGMTLNETYGYEFLLSNKKRAIYERELFYKYSSISDYVSTSNHSIFKKPETIFSNSY